MMERDEMFFYKYLTMSDANYYLVFPTMMIYL